MDDIETQSRGRRIRRIALLVLVAWLGVGLLAASQFGYMRFGSTGRANDPACIKMGARLIVIAAGPLNYLGLNTRMTNENYRFWNDMDYCD
jgi:hypothetical protein